MGLVFKGLLVIVSCFIVFYDLHVGSSDGGEDPAGIEVVLWKFFELLDRLHAVIEAEVIVAISVLLQERHKIFVIYLVLVEDYEAEWMLFFLLGN